MCIVCKCSRTEVQYSFRICTQCHVNFDLFFLCKEKYVTFIAISLIYDFSHNSFDGTKFGTWFDFNIRNHNTCH